MKSIAILLFSLPIFLLPLNFLNHAPRDQDSLSPQLFAHFMNDSLTAKDHARFREALLLINSADSSGLKSFFEKNRDWARKALLKSVYLSVFHDFTNKCNAPAFLSGDTLAILAEFYACYSGEPSLRNRISLVQNLEINQKQELLEARYLHHIADGFRRARSYGYSISYYFAALKKCREARDVFEEADLNYYLARSYYSSWRFNASLKYFQASLHNSQNARYPLRELWAKVMLGEAHVYMRNYAASKKALAGSLTAALDLRNKWAEARIRSMLGKIYSETGRLLASIDEYHHSIKLFSELGDQRSTARNLRRLGLIRRNTGAFPEAINAFKQALEIFQAKNSNDQVAAEFINISACYNSLGKHERALQSYKNALALLDSETNPGGAADAWAGSGESYAALKNLTEAEKCFAKALAFAKGDDLAAKRNEILILYANALLDHEYFQKARALYQKILKQNSGYRLGLVQCFLGLGNISFKQDSFDEALRYFSQALKSASGLDGESYDHWQAFFGRGRALAALGKTEEAISDIASAIDIVEAQTGKIRLESNRLTFFAQKQALYDEMISLHLREKKDVRQAFNFLERAKARAFLDVIQGNAEIIPASKAVFSDSLTEKDLLLSSFSESIKAHAIQSSLGPDESVIAYRIFDDYLTVFELNNDKIDCHISLIGRDSLRQLVSDFRSTIGATDEDVFRKRLRKNAAGAYREMEHLSRQLAEHLISPALRAFETYEKIYILPDDVLHYLPFGALLHPEKSAETFLIEQTSLAVLPSASALVYAKQKLASLPEISEPRVLALVDPRNDLPQARRTGGSIIELFPNSKVLTGVEAGKPALRFHLDSEFDFLHLGTHVRVNEKSPLQTEILLSLPSGANADGVLKMHEVFSFNLQRSRLVALPACETALGQFVQGEGLVGLTRAFMYAGAPAVLSTLWKVDDRATNQIMTEFYETVKTGLCFGKALQAAQIHQIQRLRQSEIANRLPHPYLWASFVLTGSLD